MLYQRSQESVVVRSNHHPLLDPRGKSQDDEENGESCDGAGCSQQLCCRLSCNLSWEGVMPMKRD